MKFSLICFFFLMKIWLAHGKEGNCEFTWKNGLLRCAGFENPWRQNSSKYQPENVIKMELVNVRNWTKLTRMNTSYFPNLEQLILKNTSLAEIDNYAFEPLPKIDQITLAQNPNFSRPFWLSFAAPKTEFHTLDLHDLDHFQCSCNLEWIANWREIQKENHLIPVPGTGTLSLSSWSYYGLPKTIVEPEFCSQKKGKRISLAEYFAHNPCQDQYPEIKLETHGSPSQDAKKIFGVGEEALLICEIPAFAQHNFSSNILEFQMARGVQQKAIVTGNDHRLSARIPNLTILDNSWIACRMSTHVTYHTPKPVVAVAPLLIQGPPTMQMIAPRTHSGWAEQICEYVLWSYPAANITWIVSDKGHIHDVHDDDEYKVTKDPINMFKFWEQTGKLSLTTMHFLQGNYTLRACNRFGCIEHLCTVWWSDPKYPKIKPYHPPVVTTREPATNEVDRWLWPALLFLGMLLIAIALLALVVKVRRAKCIDDDGHLQTVSSGVALASEMIPLNTLSENVNYSTSGLLNFPPDVPLIATSNIRITGELGEGAFGKVYLVDCKDWSITNGELLNVQDANNQVAAKKLKVYTQERLDNLRIEAANLARLKHPNIVAFFGVCLTSEEAGTIYLLFEYMKLGSLRSYLLEKNTMLNPMNQSPNDAVKGMSSSTNARSDHCGLTEAEMLDICLQISKGLAYLSDNHFVHRDLAARNCLVSEGPVVKISDFGMSRDIYCEDYYKLEGHRLLPVRWLAPEALLYGKFCPSSDVWSLAVVFWEVFTGGKQPWYAYSNHEVIQLVKEGQKLKIPEKCPSKMRDIMKSCWLFQPEGRPTAGEVVEKLHRMCNQQ